MDMSPRILLLTDVGVHGLDGLQRANHILVYSPTWSPGKLDQLKGRINRPGQQRSMHFRSSLYVDFPKCLLHRRLFLAAGTYDTAVDLRNRSKAKRQIAMLEGDEIVAAAPAAKRARLQ
jgi:hypothetical protein